MYKSEKNELYLNELAIVYKKKKKKKTIIFISIILVIITIIFWYILMNNEYIVDYNEFPNGIQATVIDGNTYFKFDLCSKHLTSIVLQRDNCIIKVDLENDVIYIKQYIQVAASPWNRIFYKGTAYHDLCLNADYTICGLEGTHGWQDDYGIIHECKDVISEVYYVNSDDTEVLIWKAELE